VQINRVAARDLLNCTGDKKATVKIGRALILVAVELAETSL
jgi:hypothetical protein